MNNTANFFNTNLTTLQSLLLKAAKQKNPAMWLHLNQGRATTFMLEGLARLAKSMHNKKRFTKMQEKFKILEDSLGAVDYFVWMHNYCKANKNVPADIKNYFAEEVENTCDALNTYLAESYFEKHAGFDKMIAKINSADWLADAEETEAIKAYFNNQIIKLHEWLTEIGEIANLEEHVHELRRKLRWLSIIPQALQGKVQLSTDKTVAPKFKKYLTPEIIKSPYNKMAAKGKLKSVVILDKNSFYALSWIIAELGKFKDQGLMQEALAIAYTNIYVGKAEEAEKATMPYGKNYTAYKVLIEQSNKTITAFMKDKILDGLVK
jgi:hypothetical protein